MRLVKLFIVIGSALTIFPGYSHAYYHFTCGTGSNMYRPVHENNTVKIAIYNSDFSNTERVQLNRAIINWNKASVGKSALTVKKVNMPTNLKQDFDAANNASSPSARALIKKNLAELSAPSAGVFVMYRRMAIPGENFFGLAELFLENGDPVTDCSSATPSDTYWKPGGGIAFNETESINTTPYYSELAGDAYPSADINYLATHEIGHILGLHHPDKKYNWNNDKYLPSIMMSGPYDFTYGGGTTFGFNYTTNYGNNRVTYPYPDDLNGIRNLYPSQSPSVTDLALNQYEFGDQWDSQFFAVRMQSLWSSFWFGGPLIGVPLNRGNYYAGYVPVTVHNLGTKGKRAEGRIRFRKVNANGTVQSDSGPSTYFNFWVSPGSHTQVAVEIKAPTSSNSPGMYLIESYLLPGSGGSRANHFEGTAHQWVVN